MSEEPGGFGANLAEKIFGLITLIIGALSLYYVVTSVPALNGFVGFFGFLNVILIIVGLVLLTAKTEE